MQEAGMKAPSKAEFQVRQQLSIQKDALSELEKGIADLAERLEGILRKESECKECKESKEPSELVPLAGEIRQHNFRIGLAIESIFGIIRRCEL